MTARTFAEQHTSALLSAGWVLVIAGGAVGALGGPSRASVLVGAVFGALVVGGYHLFTRAARLLGRLTATAVLALAGSAIFGTWAALVPVCPEETVVGRCGAPEIAAWVVAGALVPLTYLALIGIPLLSVGLGRRTVRALAGVVKRLAPRLRFRH